MSNAIEALDGRAERSSALSGLQKNVWASGLIAAVAWGAAGVATIALPDVVPWGSAGLFVKITAGAALAFVALAFVVHRLGRVGVRLAQLAPTLAQHYYAYAATVRIYTGAEVFVRIGARQLTSSGRPGPALLPTGVELPLTLVRVLGLSGASPHRRVTPITPFPIISGPKPLPRTAVRMLRRCRLAGQFLSQSWS